MTGTELAGRVVVVTGGSRGIGRAIAEACAARGARVIAASRSVKGRPAEAPPGTVTGAMLDVTNEQSVTALFDFVDRAFGRIDALVNNAGVGVFRPIDEITLDEFRAAIDTNLTGVFLCSRAAFRRMKTNGGGRIVTIGSVADRVPLREGGAYGASKYGARGLTHVLTEEGKAHRIFATLVSLGAVSTDIWNGRTGFDRRDMLSVESVAQCVVNVIEQPLSVRIDEVHLSPPKGIL